MNCDPRSKVCRAKRFEAERIALLIARDGESAAREWVERTYAIYRSAVLDRRHFASMDNYRPGFLASCAEFRHWPRLQRGKQSRAP